MRAADCVRPCGAAVWMCGEPCNCRRGITRQRDGMRMCTECVRLQHKFRVQLFAIGVNATPLPPAANVPCSDRRFLASFRAAVVVLGTGAVRLVAGGLPSRSVRITPASPRVITLCFVRRNATLRVATPSVSDLAPVATPH